MKRKVPESQLAGLKAHGEKSRAENTAKANEAIDRLYRRKKDINFKSVEIESGVSRSTLYAIPAVRDRILKLRTGCRSAPNKDFTVIKKTLKPSTKLLLPSTELKTHSLKRTRKILLRNLLKPKNSARRLSGYANVLYRLIRRNIIQF